MMLLPDDIRESVKRENRPLEPAFRDGQPEEWLTW